MSHHRQALIDLAGRNSGFRAVDRRLVHDLVVMYASSPSGHNVFCAGYDCAMIRFCCWSPQRYLQVKPYPSVHRLIVTQQDASTRERLLSPSSAKIKGCIAPSFGGVPNRLCSSRGTTPSLSAGVEQDAVCITSSTQSLGGSTTENLQSRICRECGSKSNLATRLSVFNSPRQAACSSSTVARTSMTVATTTTLWSKGKG
jgi:hypothetical protein